MPIELVGCTVCVYEIGPREIDQIVSELMAIEFSASIKRADVNAVFLSRYGF
ncbi:hypothetical protein SH449x_000694 [Pirellulaceae bacterium SH449]